MRRAGWADFGLRVGCAKPVAKHNSRMKVSLIGTAQELGPARWRLRHNAG